MSNNILRLALRKIKSDAGSKGGDPPEQPETDALEQAMVDFASATSPSDRAAAFRNALELAE